MPLCKKVIAPLLNHEVIVVNHSYFMLYVTIHTQTDSCQTSWIKKKSLEYKLKVFIKQHIMPPFNDFWNFKKVKNLDCFKVVSTALASP